MTIISGGYRADHLAVLLSVGGRRWPWLIRATMHR